MLRVFIGYDHRQPVSYTVLQHSIISQSSKPVAITPLVLPQLPITRAGLTPFTFSRFLVPYLCDFEGWALFLDADMLLLDDISQLFDFADKKYAIHVARNIQRFEWASAMLFNCGHEANKVLIPEFVETGKELHMINWLDDALIGSFPSEWNHLIGYDSPREDAKLLHYTQGIPAFPETNSCEHADKWYRVHKQANSAIPWVDLMGKSVHAIKVNGRMVPKFLINQETSKPASGQENKLRELLTDVKKDG